MNREEEQRLLRRAQQGDREAFAELYRANVQAIFRYIAARINDSQLAEDLTGEVFMRALQGLPSYRHEGLPWLAWLYRIAHARIVDVYRRQARRPMETELDSEMLAADHDLDERLHQEQTADLLRSAIARLTDEQQQVIVLRFIEGLRVEAVAQIMGKNANAIKALQHRALRAIAARLERSGLDLEALLRG